MFLKKHTKIARPIAASAAATVKINKVKTWPDKSFFEGKYKKGAKHGKGKYKYADGSIYYGDWSHNQISG